LLDVARYRRVDTAARGPESLYPAATPLGATANAAFLVECVRRFREINFADQASGRIYARVESGRLASIDSEALSAAASDADTRAGLAATVPEIFDAPSSGSAESLTERFGPQRIHTLGRWGPE
jgi:hypothetical protein